MASRKKHDAFSIAFETKRYTDTTKLNARELAGELFQVSQVVPDLDLWILAATKEVGDLAEDLKSGAEKLGIDVLVLDARVDRLGPLQILCAKHPAVIENFTKTPGKTKGVEEVTKQLTETLNSHLFNSAVTRLNNTLHETLCGIATARSSCYNWLNTHVSSKREANAAFSQDLGIFESGQQRVVRKGINQEFDCWWESRNSDWSTLVLLGEEGTGKTWALFSWLVDRFNNSQGPIVLPITSAQLSQTKNLAETIATALQERCGRTREYWQRKIKAWPLRPVNEPFVLLCFDGLNEYPDFPWRQIFCAIS